MTAAEAASPVRHHHFAPMFVRRILFLDYWGNSSFIVDILFIVCQGGRGLRRRRPQALGNLRLLFVVCVSCPADALFLSKIGFISVSRAKFDYHMHQVRVRYNRVYVAKAWVVSGVGRLKAWVVSASDFFFLASCLPAVRTQVRPAHSPRRPHATRTAHAAGSALRLALPSLLVRRATALLPTTCMRPWPQTLPAIHHCLTWPDRIVIAQAPIIAGPSTQPRCRCAHLERAPRPPWSSRSLRSGCCCFWGPAANHSSADAHTVSRLACGRSPLRFHRSPVFSLVSLDALVALRCSSDAVVSQKFTAAQIDSYDGGRAGHSSTKKNFPEGHKWEGKRMFLSGKYEGEEFPVDINKDNKDTVAKLVAQAHQQFVYVRSRPKDASPTLGCPTLSI